MTSRLRELLGDDPVRRLRQWLNDHKIVTVGASALVVVVCAWIAYGRLTARPRELPPTSFRCAEGHTWRARVSAAPTCPTCGGPGITEAHYQCRACGRPFLGLEMRKLGVGRMDFRAAGTQEWRHFPPRTLSCPHCKAAGSLEGGPFIPLGRNKDPAALPADGT